MSQAALNTRNSDEETPSSRRNNGTRLAGILFLLTVLCTVFVSGWVVLGWMEDAQRLPLSKLVLTGERHYTRNDDIRQAILALGAPGTFMTQDVNIIQSQIERLPWIKQASVRKQWPDELKIHLVEYVPIARWNDQHMVDAKGIPSACRQTASANRFYPCCMARKAARVKCCRDTARWGRCWLRINSL